MAIYEVGCTDATLRMDTDKDLITIERKGRMSFNLPPLTEIKISSLTGIEHRFVGAVVRDGSGTYKFLYPGAPEGGDLLTGYSTHENMVQYSGKHKPEADAFNAALKAYLAEIKAAKK
jgi:hypothetical protein